ncbi:MAG: choice-of-anchor Q domain-containing protein, partial [Pseudomonadota bacterium]
MTTGVLADNGGPVQTVALKASLSNPAIDAGVTPPTERSLGVDVDGDGTVENTPISVDARGVARSIDVPGVSNTTGPTDIGAFEAQTTPTPGPDILTGTTGNDSLAAAAGNDLILPGTGNDTVDGGSGTNDTVSYADLFDTTPSRDTFGVRVSLADQGSVQVTRGNPNRDPSIGSGNDLLTGFENLTG